MKICFRVTSHPKYSAGGAERQMELIGRHLIDKQVEVHYYINRIHKNQISRNEAIRKESLIKVFSYIASGKYLKD